MKRNNFSSITTNVNIEIKKKFIEYCKKNKTTPNKELKEYIYTVIDQI